MKNKFLKSMSLFLSLSITFSSLPSVLAGGIFSKPKSKLSTHQRYVLSRPEYRPPFAYDGGKEYYAAWNGTNEGQDFDTFIKAYSKMIENEKSASSLKDSVRNTNWYSHTFFGEVYKIEETESYFPGEYILRVDYENKIIYTIRKSGSEYFFTFYLLCVNSDNPTDVKCAVDYYLLLPSQSNVKKLLLPIDKELLN